MSIALVRNPGDGPAFRYYNTGVEQVVSTDETNGAITVSRLKMPRSDAPPLHTHSREDESWVILSGRVRFWIGSTSLAECDVYDAEAGAFIYGPRLVPHTLQPITDTAEILQINSPGAVEGYFKAIGPGETRADEDHIDLLTHYGVALLDKPPAA